MGLGALLTDALRAPSGEVTVDARVWPRSLRAQFPGARLRESWVGEGAAFARYTSPGGLLFLKYLPAGWRDRRAAQRLARETTYLRDLAPGCPVPHAPLLHAAISSERPLAHLLMRDLTDETTGWGFFTDDAAREEGLRDVVRLLAALHAHWAGPGRAVLSGEWVWRPEHVANRHHVRGLLDDSRVLALPAAQRDALMDAAQALPALLRDAPVWTLVHGDIHAGQVLWSRADGTPVLIDYGQVHPSVPGEDLAHLLALRLDAGERARLGDELRAVYADALAQAGLPLSPAALRAQERAGLALNLLSTARQTLRQKAAGSGGVAEALARAAQVWSNDTAT
ncbi:phosphotransferase family protein [Deinococcus kurensis]|uniref:phosphotransferase family protein n=1 Tax=Deinococcus kurensis TaxID=2662757 RepID=UPI0012D2E40E|nr:aminoglycoside phosphotransferase family protein [Deinococcus kurensis]